MEKTITPVVGPSVAKAKAITGRVIRVAGNCMMPSSSTPSASSPAPGMPLTTKPRPTSSIWMKAMPITPSATARMVAVHSSTILPPRPGPDRRMAMRRALCVPFSP
ncbi:hypothetical protein D9M70_520390 [compost metagenome]